MQDKWGGWKWGVEGAPWGPLGPPWGPLGPWAPWAALAGRPVGPWAPNPLLWVADKFKTLPENRLFGILESKTGHQKVGIQAPGPHGEIRAGILCRIPVLK